MLAVVLCTTLINATSRSICYVSTDLLYLIAIDTQQSVLETQFIEIVIGSIDLEEISKLDLIFLFFLLMLSSYCFELR